MTLTRKPSVTRLAPTMITIVAAFALTACGSQAESYVSTFTDKHGRVCTTVVIIEGGSGSQDIDVTPPDCEYPPKGRTPGPNATQSLPGGTVK